MMSFISLSRCSQEKTSSMARYQDTTVRVYGPYVAVKLPITKGVKMGNPIQLALGPRDLLFASNQTGEIYTLHDHDGDGLEDSTVLYCNVKDLGLRSPVGFTHRGDTVYVGTAQQVRIFIDRNHDNKADTSWTFYDQIPQSEHPYEWISGLSFGPDRWLYCAITTDSWNAGPAPDPKQLRGAIIRISPDGKTSERMATGIRSVPGMAFNEHGDLFFVDNEGGGNRTEELNRLEKNAFYGHNKNKYPNDSATVTGPEFDLQSEVAPSSLEFNKRDNDFGGTAGNLFVAYYGPGERWTRGAVGRVDIKRNSDGTYAYAEYTIADVPKLSDLAFGKDGNLYVANHGQADYWYNAVYNEQGGFYKLVYDPSIRAKADYVRKKEAKEFSKNTLTMGRQLFAESGCLGCHAVDGTTELLGPNLKDVAKNYSRAEILEEILTPSARIKPSMGGMRITKKDGNILLGRVINSDQANLSFMLVGNAVVTVSRSDVAKMENEKKSLMFEGLINGLPDDKREALLDYLTSLSQSGE
jgi:putative heme-binding domain-containing protein